MTVLFPFILENLNSACKIHAKSDTWSGMLPLCLVNWGSSHLTWTQMKKTAPNVWTCPFVLTLLKRTWLWFLSTVNCKKTTLTNKFSCLFFFNIWPVVCCLMAYFNPSSKFCLPAHFLVVLKWSKVFAALHHPLLLVPAAPATLIFFCVFTF